MRGVPAAHLTSSTKETTSRAILRELHAAAEGRVDYPTLKLLYVTPERLALSENFRDVSRSCIERTYWPEW